MGFSITSAPKGSGSLERDTRQPIAAILFLESQNSLSPLNAFEVPFLKMTSTDSKLHRDTTGEDHVQLRMLKLNL